MTTTNEQLFNIKKNQIMMIQRRGFDVKDEINILNYSLSDFLELYEPYVKKPLIFLRQTLTQIYEKKAPQTGKIFVYYAASTGDKQVGVNVVRDFILEIDTIENLTDAIMITERSLTSEANDALRNVIPMNVEKNIRTIYFQHFIDQELMYDITQHCLQPKFELMTSEDTQEFYKRMGIKPGQLPILKYVDPFVRPSDKEKDKITDPIVKYYGYRPGQLIRIRRNAATIVAKESFIGDVLVREYTTYRIVSY